MDTVTREEFDALSARLTKLEDSLDFKGIVKKPVPVKVRTEPTKIQPESIVWSWTGGVLGWGVHFNFQCPCGIKHSANMTASTNRGALYELITKCDRRVVVWLAKEEQ